MIAKRSSANDIPGRLKIRSGEVSRISGEARGTDSRLNRFTFDPWGKFSDERSMNDVGN